MTLVWLRPAAGLNSIIGNTSKLMNEIMKGCRQLKQQFLSEIIGLAIEHRAQVGKIVSLSLKGLDLTVKEPSSIYSAHLLFTINCDSLS